MLIPQIVWGQLLLETLISCVRWSYRSISCPFCFCSVYYLRMSRIILCWPMQWYWRKPAFVLFSFILNNCISPATWRPCAAVIAMELSSVEILSDSQLQEGKCHAEYSTSPFWYHQSFSETFGSDLFCLLTGDFFCVSPPLQKRGSVMLQEAATWHLVLSPALSLERMRSAARGGVISLSTFEFTK